MELREKIEKIIKDNKIKIYGFAPIEVDFDLTLGIKKQKEKGYDSIFVTEDPITRTNPKLLMNDAKSIIVLGIPYPNKYQFTPSNCHHGIIARTSWGKDYHNVLKDKMHTICNDIAMIIPDFKYEYMVDTGVLDERVFAYLSGIGFYGKNNLIINREYGSFIFLGLIVTNIELETNETYIESKCGECTKCLNACPTGAIEEGNVINSKKCVSFLTQTKDIIDDDLKERMGNKLYGCDICQTVCPFNKDRNQIMNSFEPDGLEKIPLSNIFNLSNRQFKERYGHKAMAWRGKNIILRNAIIAAANLKAYDLIENINEVRKNTNIDYIIDACQYAKNKLEIGDDNDN